MRILLTGQNGQVGWELSRSLLPLGTVITLNREQLDMMNPESCRSMVQQYKPDVIVNAAAYTMVDQAEKESELAMKINGIAPGVLAEEARKLNALLVHYSTDYVFDGTKISPYTEDDAVNPINVYGHSKLIGEKAIQKSGCDYIMLRTSWVYAARGRNFLITMLKLMQERESLSVVYDQNGAPTWSRLISDVTSHIIRQSVNERKLHSFHSETYNLASSNVTNWHEFAIMISNIVRQDIPACRITIENILPITSREYMTAAKRPANSQLALDKLQNKFNLILPDWDKSVRLCIQEYFALCR